MESNTHNEGGDLLPENWKELADAEFNKISDKTDNTVDKAGYNRFIEEFLKASPELSNELNEHDFFTEFSGQSDGKLTLELFREVFKEIWHLKHYEGHEQPNILDDAILF